MRDEGLTISNDTVSLTFSSEELYFLTCLLPTKGFIGVGYPFLGLLAEEVEQRLEQAKRSLAERGYLTILDDGRVILDIGVTGFVGTATNSRYTLIASCTLTGGTPDIRLIHVGRDVAVEQENLSADRIVLRAVPDIKAVQRRLKKFLDLPRVAQGPWPAFSLNGVDFNEARRLAMEEGEEACRAFLSRVEVPSEAVEPLAVALAKGPVTGSLVVLHREAREMRYGETLAWLVGSQGAWRIQPLTQQEPVAVRLIPAATAEIQQRITDLVESVYQEIRQ